MRNHYNSYAGGDVGRIEALSDGIFAFAATVLVLDFRSPEPGDIHSEAELVSALAASAHRLMPWLLSLLTLGIFYGVGVLVGLVSVPLGIALIILVQLNYAFAPRLPILSRL
jgi:hypothetical protein